MMWRVLVVSVCLLSTTQLYGANEVFIVQQSITGTDVVAPSVPSITSAIPVSTSQIDVSWSASTDNQVVDGYQLYRDEIFLATTTLTSYSDTGLSASTTYGYTVRAFDVARNYSASSSAVATTTLAPSVSTPPADTGPGGKAGIDLELLNFEIIPDTQTARFSWQTNRYTRYVLHWGRTFNYELGSVSTEVFSRDHLTLVTDLESSTVYEYELIAYERSGNEYRISAGQFTTDAAVDNVAPPNVSGLRAIMAGERVVLNWENPSVDDFDRVRIVRNPYFFPLDPNDGRIVYQGSGETFVDTSTFELGNIEYYSVFTYDTAGNVSSGAVVYVEREVVDDVIGIPTSDITPTLPGVPDIVSTPQASSTDDDQKETTTIEIDFADITITQNGRAVPTVDDKLLLDGERPVTVAIPYELLPEHLKTILVTFTHPDDDSLQFSFLLRINKDKTAYEATIAPLQYGGVYGLSLLVFDYETRVIIGVAGDFEVLQAIPETGMNELTSDTMALLNWLLIILLCLFVIFLLWLLFRKKRER